MNKLFLFAALLLAACKHNTQSGQELPLTQDTVPERQTITQKMVPETAEDPFPDVSGKYYMRAYSDALQKELDERNAKRQKHTEEMTLLDAGLGEDAAYIDFSDAKGRKRSFRGWSYDIPLKLHVTEDGEYPDESEKGKKYNVTWSLEAYWSDPGGEVVEQAIVRAMEEL